MYCVCVCLCLRACVCLFMVTDDSGHWGRGGLFTALELRSDEPRKQYELAGDMKGSTQSQLKWCRKICSNIAKKIMYKNSSSFRAFSAVERRGWEGGKRVQFPDSLVDKDAASLVEWAQRLLYLLLEGIQEVAQNLLLFLPPCSEKHPGLSASGPHLLTITAACYLVQRILD